MTLAENNTAITRKAAYIPPQLNIIRLHSVDIITTSGKDDENQGEWDPQGIF